MNYSTRVTNFQNIFNQVWQCHLYSNMKAAGEEGKRIAIKKGHITSDGTPYNLRRYSIYYSNCWWWLEQTYLWSWIQCIFWSCTFCLYNSYISICFTCTILGGNYWRGYEKVFTCRSTQQILCCSVFARIVEKVPYGRQVEKIECAKHMTRCVSDKLHKLAKSTSYLLQMRKLLSDKASGISRIERLVKGVRTAIKRNALNPEKIREEVKNAPMHVFGRHTKCRYECMNNFNSFQTIYNA